MTNYKQDDIKFYLFRKPRSHCITMCTTIFSVTRSNHFIIACHLHTHISEKINMSLTISNLLIPFTLTIPFPPYKTRWSPRQNHSSPLLLLYRKQSAAALLTKQSYRCGKHVVNNSRSLSTPSSPVFRSATSAAGVALFHLLCTFTLSKKEGCRDGGLDGHCGLE